MDPAQCICLPTITVFGRLMETTRITQVKQLCLAQWLSRCLINCCWDIMRAFLRMDKQDPEKVTGNLPCCGFSGNVSCSSSSMMGIDGGKNDLCQGTGIIPRFCSALFERAAQAPHEICVEISYYEIYNEKIHDLLASHTGVQRPALRVREHPSIGPYVVDLAVHGVTSFSDVKVSVKYFFMYFFNK